LWNDFPGGKYTRTGTALRERPRHPSLNIRSIRRFELINPFAVGGFDREVDFSILIFAVGQDGHFVGVDGIVAAELFAGDIVIQSEQFAGHEVGIQEFTL